MRTTSWIIGGSVLAAAFGATAAAQPRGFEAAVMEEFNAMRSNPSRYARVLAATRPRYDGKILRGRSDDEIDIRTHEGVAALDEAIAALRAASAVPTLAHSDVLTSAARDHVAAQSRSGEVGHRSRGRDPGGRVVARGGGPYVSEVIGYGHSDPASAIELLLVDDGVPGRGHRHMMLGAQYRYAGTACGSHPVHRTMCVIMMSETPDGSPPPPPRRGGGAPD